MKHNGCYDLLWETYSISETTIVLGDCLEVMKAVDDESVDLVLCDLPYGTTACKWDATLPFEALWKEYKRVVKANSAIVLTATQPFTTALISSNKDDFKYCWVWEKTRAGGVFNAKNMPLKMHEDIAVFSTGTTANGSTRRMTYNPQGLVRVDRTVKNVVRSGSDTIGNRPSRSGNYTQEFTGYPGTILRYANDTGHHPTQKPVALMKYLIRTYTNPGDVVLDNCMGSGTTGVACANTGRRFIGIEKEPRYFEIARARLDEAVYSAVEDLV